MNLNDLLDRRSLWRIHFKQSPWVPLGAWLIWPLIPRIDWHAYHSQNRRALHLPMSVMEVCERGNQMSPHWTPIEPNAIHLGSFSRSTVLTQPLWDRMLTFWMCPGRAKELRIVRLKTEEADGSFKLVLTSFWSWPMFCAADFNMFNLLIN
jgi:hypothetical protein